MIKTDETIRTAKRFKRLNTSDNVKLKHYLDLRVGNQLITVL